MARGVITDRSHVMLHVIVECVSRPVALYSQEL